MVQANVGLGCLTMDRLSPSDCGVHVVHGSGAARDGVVIRRWILVQDMIAIGF